MNTDVTRGAREFVVTGTRGLVSWRFLAELPFDAAHKLLATVHRMEGANGSEVLRCFVRGAPDQLSLY